MFGIISNGSMDKELFNELYEENKKIIENLKFYMEEAPDMLDLKLEELSYDQIVKLLRFLNYCKVNYTTINLTTHLEGYIRKKEDELFLDLYIAYQDGSVDTWIDSRSLSELQALMNGIQNDSSFEFIFLDLYAAVLKRIK